MAIALVRQGSGTATNLFVIYAVGFALLFAYALARSFYLVCIRGAPVDPGAESFCATDPSTIPGPVWDALQRATEAVNDTTATHLGHMRIANGMMLQYSSVWWTDDGTTIIYASASAFEMPSGKQVPQGEHVTISSGSHAGDQIQTTNQKYIPSKDQHGHSVRAFPQWMPFDALQEIHRARVAAAPLVARRLPCELGAVVHANNEALRKHADLYLRGTRQGSDGRQRITIGMWALTVAAQLPPVRALRRVRWHAMLRRELRDLGLLHLWKKPA